MLKTSRWSPRFAGSKDVFTHIYVYAFTHQHTYTFIRECVNMRMCDFIIPTADKRKGKMCFRQPDRSVSINRERNGEKEQRRSPEIEQGAEEEPGRDRKIQRSAI